MINVLVGALVGGVLNVIGYAVVQKVRGQPLAWKDATASFVGGAVGGALCGATFGASLLAEGGVGAVAFLSVDGAASWGSERVTSNALEGRPLGEDVAHDMAIGAVEAPLFYGLTRVALPKGAASPVAATLGEAGPSFTRRVTGTLTRLGLARSTSGALANAVGNATSTWTADLGESAICYLLPEGKGEDEEAPPVAAPADVTRTTATRATTTRAERSMPARPPVRGFTRALAGAH